MVSARRKIRCYLEYHKQLNSLGVIWDAYLISGNEGLKYLRIYNSREGHSRVPSITSKTVFRSEHGFIIDAEARTQCLRNIDSNLTSLILFGTHSVRTGVKLLIF